MDDSRSNGLADNRALSRFEWREDNETSFVSYHHEGTTLVLDHSFVPECLAGRGIGSKMVHAVLDTLVARREKPVIRCDFIDHIVRDGDIYRGFLEN